MFSDTTKLYTDTTPIDRDKACLAVRELYKFCNVSSHASYNKDKPRPVRDPEIVIVDGPTELKTLIKELFKRIACGFLKEEEGDFFDAGSFNDIAHFVNKRGWSSKERMRSVIAHEFKLPLPDHTFKAKDGRSIIKKRRGWSSPMMLAIDYLYISEDNKEDRCGYDRWERMASKIWDNAYLVVTFLNKCFVVDRPKEVHINEMGFHRTDGPALVFRDGTEVYAYEGLGVEKKYIMEKDSLTLKDVHQHNSRKHYLIDLMGVDRYLKLVKEWKPPETKGRFNKFFSFARMVLPTDDLPDEKDERGFTKYRERGFGYHSYKDKPYEVDFYLGKVNGEFGLVFSARDGGDIYHFPYDTHPFDTEHCEIFEEQDRELWDLFDVKEMFSRSSAATFTLSYQNKKFRLKSDLLYEHHPTCRHDVAPAWFKAKMFRQEEVEYVSSDEKYGVRWEPNPNSATHPRGGDLLFAGEFPGDKEPRGSLFGGCENLPGFSFTLDLEADSWEGLLEKWARLAFDWLHLHEDSSRMP